MAAPVHRLRRQIPGVDVKRELIYYLPMKQIIMVKKEKADGSPCEKCGQVEEQLRERGLWERIDQVIWAVENQSESEGMKLARKYNVTIAPFFIVKEDGEERLYKSSLLFIKKELADQDKKKRTSKKPDAPEAETLLEELAGKSPEEIVKRALEIYGQDCTISFSGAEDVALIHMAAETGLPFSVFSLDTGRLFPETYRFIQKVRDHYGVAIRVISPDREELEKFTEEKGLFSFLKEGHTECCQVRKVRPLKRALSDYKAWITGQRKDQNPSTRGDLDEVEKDNFTGRNGNRLIKFNPLANWTQKQIWSYIRSRDIPYNELHDRGFVSIGCEPCTRAQQPGEHERASRWWWEEGTKRECGLHS